MAELAASTGIGDKIAAMSGATAIADQLAASTGIAEKIAAMSVATGITEKFQADFAGSTGIADQLAASTGIADKIAAMSVATGIADKFQARFAASRAVAAAQLSSSRAIPDLGPLFRQLPNVAAMGEDMVPQFSFLATQLSSSTSLLPSIDKMAAQILSGPYRAESAAHEVEEIAARLLEEADSDVLSPTDLHAGSMVSPSQFAVVVVLVFIVTAAFSPEMRNALAAEAVTSGLLLEMAHQAIRSSPSLEGALELYGLFTLIGGIVRLLQKGLHSRQGDK